MNSSNDALKDNKEWIIVFLPLVAIEIYLTFTVLVFLLGPIKWHIQNLSMFLLYIVLYHVAFIGGYVVYWRSKHEHITYSHTKNEYSPNLILIIGSYLCYIICYIISFPYTTGIVDISLNNITQQLLIGLTNPASVYFNKAVQLSALQPNPALNAVQCIIAPMAWFSFVLPIIWWDKLKLPYKIVFCLILIFEMGKWVLIGTNKGVFDLLIALVVVIAFDAICGYIKGNIKTWLQHKIPIVLYIVLLTIFSFYFIGLNMTTRVGSVTTYLEKSIPQKQAEVKFTGSNYDRDSTTGSSATGQLSTADSSRAFQIMDNARYGLLFYITHGYYGMSLAISRPFTSTYGIGNSYFLTRQVERITGVSMFERTYMAKLEPEWSATGLWHTCYTWLACDVSFVGVVLIMFILGLFLARTWMDAIFGKNIFSIALLPVLAIMFVYMPCNNQVMANGPSFCTFWGLAMLSVVYPKYFGAGKRGDQGENQPSILRLRRLARRKGGRNGID
ncbi:MAG: hypothetical protein HPY74_19390 [Firmicutes bacterium]|nr:hypothetical protein [Bacillota bacterium]